MKKILVVLNVFSFLVIVGCAKNYYYRSEKKVVTDENIDITFHVDTVFISLTVKNKTNKIIKILWDECGFINHYGNSFRVSPPFVPLTVVYQPKTPTLIAPNGTDVNTLKTHGITEIVGEKKAKKLIGLTVGLIVTISIDNIKKSFYIETKIKQVFTPEKLY